MPPNKSLQVTFDPPPIFATAKTAAGLDPSQRLAPESLGALDHFHTGGLAATRELLELARVGANPISDFPLPWASTPDDNFLITPDAMPSMFGDCGFVTELFEDTSDAHLGKSTANATPAPAGSLGLSVFVDDLGQKARNARRSLEENQVRLVRGVSRAG